MNKAIWQEALAEWVAIDTWCSGNLEDELRFEQGVSRAAKSGQSVVDASAFNAAVMSLAHEYGRPLPSAEDLHHRYRRAAAIADLVALGEFAEMYFTE